MISAVGTNLNNLLGSLGLKGADVGAVDTLAGNRLGMLQNMHDSFLETALGKGSGARVASTLGQVDGMSPFLAIPKPLEMLPVMGTFCNKSYASVEIAETQPSDLFKRLMRKRRRTGAKTERFLRNNPQGKAAFESMFGGQILSFTNNKITMQQYTPEGVTSSGMSSSPYAGTCMGYLAQMDAAIMEQASYLGSLGTGTAYDNSGFMGMTLGGMMNIAGIQGSAGTGYGTYDNSGPMGGRAWGSWNPLAMPGQINNTNPTYESAHQAEVQSVLADPSLTVEDKVTLMIMLIMNKMDEDIENQAQYINSIQQQQSSRTDSSGKGGKGASGTSTSGLSSITGTSLTDTSDTSIDVETMKLKRMIDKRSQMFDMLRQIIDKYNQTAKGIIDSIGR